MKQAHFADIEPGDILGFSSCAPLSAAINLFTGGLLPLRNWWRLGIFGKGLNHVAFAVDLPGFKSPVLTESTTSHDAPCLVKGKLVEGVQFHPLRTHILKYPGHCYLFRLTDPLLPSERRALMLFALGMSGVGYDAIQAMEANDTWIAPLFRKPEDLTTVFCSEYMMAALRKLGKTRVENVSEWSPNRAVAMLLKTGVLRKPLRLT